MIIGEYGSDPHHDGVVHRAQEMHAVAGALPGDGGRPPPRKAGLAVRGDRELERDLGSLLAHAADVARMGLRGFGRAGPGPHGNAGSLETRMPPAGKDRKSTRLNSSHSSISYDV